MLSDRQIELLEAIIREYILSSEPVGSTSLVKKYGFDYSAATVRNEMARLIEEGFLQMLHTSSGRVPTPRAYKFYLSELMEEEEVPVLHEVVIKQRAWPARFDTFKLLRQLTLSLSEMLNQLVFAATEDGQITYSGVEKILDFKEFWDIDVTKAVLHLVDRYELLDQIFHKVPSEKGDVYCVIGEELGNEKLSQCAAVFSPFETERIKGNIGVLGPSRMNYSQVIPALRYATQLIDELTTSI